MGAKWAYLCSCPRRLRLTAKFAKPWLAKSKLDWVVCVPDNALGYNEICDAAAEARAAIFEVTDYYPEYNETHYPKVYQGSMPEHLGYKLSLPSQLPMHWDVLYTDDDVIVQREPVLGARPFASHIKTSRYQGIPQDELEVRTWCEALDLAPISVWKFNNIRTDAGIAYWPRYTRNDYEVLCMRFFDAALALNLTGNRFRMIDQRLWTMFNYMKHGTQLVSDYKILCGRTPSRSKKTFIHYCAGRHKLIHMEYYENIDPN